jgi:hypothetical protein
MILPIPEAPPVISTFADLICIVLRVLKVLKVLMDLIQIIYQTAAKVVYYFRTNVQKRIKSAFFSNKRSIYVKKCCVFEIFCIPLQSKMG